MGYRQDEDDDVTPDGRGAAYWKKKYDELAREQREYQAWLDLIDDVEPD